MFPVFLSFTKPVNDEVFLFSTFTDLLNDETFCKFRAFINNCTTKVSFIKASVWYYFCLFIFDWNSELWKYRNDCHVQCIKQNTFVEVSPGDSKVFVKNILNVWILRGSENDFASSLCRNRRLRDRQVFIDN